MAHRQNTRSDKAIAWLRENGGSFADAAKQFKLTCQAISYRWLMLYPDEPTPAQEIRIGRDEAIKDMAKAGRSKPQIEAALGEDTRRVSEVLRDAKIVAPGVIDSRRAKLAEAVNEVASGGFVADVAAKFNLSHGYLQRAVT